MSVNSQKNDSPYRSPLLALAMALADLHAGRELRRTKTELESKSNVRVHHFLHLLVEEVELRKR